ncbi:hypothetical protein LPMP_250720 [Leishmania panamensis]|uniref:Uncharacterized protein n=1 Tax=Leishmania panamensis TaxID=5679 RepID=A0A088SB99_LEIPA|nr:hypothetical protein LPMP_250720 [Leishmania panamensis]AIN98936.1 hypothetical protein LPMP_250720 [Leishmania panamensis]
MAKHIQRMRMELRATRRRMWIRCPTRYPATYDCEISINEFDRAVRCPPCHSATTQPVAAVSAISTLPVPSRHPVDGAERSLELKASTSQVCTLLNVRHGESTSTAHQLKPQQSRHHNGLLCRHYVLDSIVFLSLFTHICCIEYWSNLRSCGVNVQGLEQCHLEIPEDIFVVVPGGSTADTREVRKTDEGPPPMGFPCPSTWLFDFEGSTSFHYLLFIDVVCGLQEQSGFVKHTSVLLLHGTQGVLVLPTHTVAITTKLCQCTKDAANKVYLDLLRDARHNLDGTHIIHPFLRDIIILPHLRRQRALRGELDATLRHSVELQQQQKKHTDPSGGASISVSAGGTIGRGERLSPTSTTQRTTESIDKDSDDRKPNEAHTWWKSGASAPQE